MKTWLVALGFALVVMQAVSVEWVPACGGVSLGAPLPFVTAWAGSSMTFDWHPLGFFVDLGGWTAVCALLVRRAKVSAWSLGVTVPMAVVLAVTWAPGSVATAWPASSGPRQLAFHLGPPRWDSHVERWCD